MKIMVFIHVIEGNKKNRPFSPFFPLAMIGADFYVEIQDHKSKGRLFSLEDDGLRKRLCVDGHGEQVPDKKRSQDIY